MKAVMYGAGNIGRGFIAPVFSGSGCEVTFIDVEESVIITLNRDGRYPVRILSGGGSEDIWVEGVRAVNGNNGEAVNAVAEADIMATAVGVRALSFIAPVIAAGIKKRFAPAGGALAKPLNIIICENLIDSNRILGFLIREYLNEEEKNYFDKNVGLVRASVGKMVPLQTAEMRDGNPLRVCVEPYNFLPVDKAAFRGEIPRIKGMNPFDNFDFYTQRKLFIHNMGHAVCAYLGTIRGNTYIWEAISNGNIHCIVQNAMLESALALSVKYNTPLSDLHYHIRDLLRRFANRALGDTCARVGGDTLRKLGSGDRLAGALRCCVSEGVTPAFISAGTAAALYCHLNENNIPQSAGAARAVLAGTCGFPENSAEAAGVMAFYLPLSQHPCGENPDSLFEGIILTASETTAFVRRPSGPAASSTNIQNVLYCKMWKNRKKDSTTPPCFAPLGPKKLFPMS